MLRGIGNRCVPDVQLLPDGLSFPISTMEEFDEMNERALDVEAKTSLVSFM